MDNEKRFQTFSIIAFTGQGDRSRLMKKSLFSEI